MFNIINTWLTKLHGYLQVHYFVGFILKKSKFIVTARILIP